MTKSLVALFCGITLLMPMSLFGKAYTLTLPNSASQKSSKNPYVEELLELVFAAQGYELSINYYLSSTNKIRTARIVADNGPIDIYWSVAMAKPITGLHAIEKPIYKGYIGWRVFLINKASVNKISEVKTVGHLRQYVGAQKFDWIDYRILRSNGLKLISDIGFNSMFRAVESGMVDYFPRSVLEAEKERLKYGTGKLQVETGLLLRYRSASYFYINQEDLELAEILENGFANIEANGQFNQHFERHFGAVLSNLQLNKRRVIELPNPFFPE